MSREIDKLIAQHIFGLNVVCDAWPCGYMECEYEATTFAKKTEDGWIDDELGFKPDLVYCNEEIGWPPHFDDTYECYVAWVQPVPHYSTDDAAACQVWDKLIERGWWVTIGNEGTLWESYIYDDSQGTFNKEGAWPKQLAAVDDITSRPKAICLAALQAVSVLLKVDLNDLEALGRVLQAE